MSDQMGLEIDTETRKVSRIIEIQLQPAELGALGIEAGRISGELETATRKKETVVKEHSSIVKGLDSQLQDVLDKLQKRTESREVECDEKRCFSTNTLTITHEGTIVEERAMTVEERQMSFGEPRNGVVMDAEEEEDGSEFSEEQRKQDLEETMHEERQANKPSLVDMRPQS